MVETTGIKKIGNSLGIYLDKGVLEKVYHVGEGDKVEIEYRFSEICIKPVIIVPEQTVLE